MPRAALWLLAGAALALIGRWMIQAPAAPYEPGVQIKCVNSDDRERLKSLAIAGLDEAFKGQIGHLYQVWMRDSRDQPRRAQAGATQAVAAWLGARKGMEAFEPPECPKTP